MIIIQVDLITSYFIEVAVWIFAYFRCSEGGGVPKGGARTYSFQDY